MLNLAERVDNKISIWYPTWVLLMTTIQTPVSRSLCQTRAGSNNQKAFSILLKTIDRYPPKTPAGITTATDKIENNRGYDWL